MTALRDDQILILANPGLQDGRNVKSDHLNELGQRHPSERSGNRRAHRFLGAAWRGEREPFR